MAKKLAEIEVLGTRRLHLRDGSAVEVPLRAVKPAEKGDPKTVCDFSQMADDFGNKLECDWCGGRAGDRGMIEGGLVTFYQIGTDGSWRSTAGACPRCVFGAFRRHRQKIGWSDSLSGVPALSDQEWALLHLWHQKGDGYAEAAGRIPETIDARRLLEVLRVPVKKEAQHV
jgi:hypothetical protein